VHWSQSVIDAFCFENILQQTLCDGQQAVSVIDGSALSLALFLYCDAVHSLMVPWNAFKSMEPLVLSLSRAFG